MRREGESERKEKREIERIKKLLKSSKFSKFTHMLEAKLQVILWKINLTEIMQHPARLRGKEKTQYGYHGQLQ